MRAALLVLAFASACLQTGDPLYIRNDAGPPEVLVDQCVPPIFSRDAGLQMIMPQDTLQIPFSETMDPGSLRPGIAVFDNPEHDELPLNIAAPPPGTIPFVVHVSATDGGFASGIYTVQLRTLLLDNFGNPIPEQLTGFFSVP